MEQIRIPRKTSEVGVFPKRDRGAPLARIERRIRLKAPVSEVFAYIADFRTLKDYNPSVLQVNGAVDGPPAKGSRCHITLSMFGWKIRPVLTITDIKQNELIVTRLDSFIPADEKRQFKQAGPEQVNRKGGARGGCPDNYHGCLDQGVRVTGSILGVIRRDESIRPAKTGIVINRVKGDDEPITESAKRWGLQIFGRIPEDENITEYDSVGKPMIDLPHTSPSVLAVAEILKKIVPKSLTKGSEEVHHG